MNFDSHTGTTIPGTGTEGTTSGVLETDFVTGIRGTSLYIHDGGKVALAGSSKECWTNLTECTSGMTVSIWYKPDASNSGPSFIVGSGGNVRNSFSLFVEGNNGPQMVVYRSDGRLFADAVTKAVADVWILITGTYHPLDGATTVSINGMLESYGQPDDVVENPNTDWRGHIGVKDIPPYANHGIVGTVDQFKLFYRVLNSVGLYIFNPIF